MNFSARRCVKIVTISILCLFVLVRSQTWNEEFPFQWMTDSFTAGGPLASRWTWTSCMLRTPPNSWDNLNITGNAAFFMANGTSCYITPSNSGTTWVLPNGPIKGAAIQVSMHGGSFRPTGPVAPGQDVPCCHNATSQEGVEYGVRQVSYANYHLGEIVQAPCGCPGGNVMPGLCMADIVTAFEVWSLGPSIKRSQRGLDWLALTSNPNDNCEGQATIGSYCKGGCSTVTTVKAVPGNSSIVTVEVPEMVNGFTLPPVNVSTSVVTLALTAARRFQFLRFGSGSSAKTTSFLNEFTWLLGMRDVAIYLPGQCYDNNIVNGDGCDTNNFVEFMCYCSRTTTVFKTSVCACPTASNLLTTAGAPLLASSFVNPDQQIIVSGSRAQNLSLAYSKRTTFLLDNCPHDKINCMDPRISRFLRLSINGTWQAPFEPVFTPCSEDVCGPNRFYVDLAGAFAPFEYGTQLQFVWWMNTKQEFAPGLLHQNGSLLAVSPRLTLTKISPQVNGVGYVYLLAGFDHNVTFASNVRDPDAIEVFLYEGTPASLPASTNISVNDPFLTLLDCNCTTSLYGSPIRHFCAIRIPAPRFPDNNLYLVARVTHGEVVGEISYIGANVGANTFLFWNSEPVIARDTSKTSLYFPGTALAPDMEIGVYVGDVAVPCFETFRGRTGISFNLIIPIDSNHFTFPSTGPLIISYSKGPYQVNATVSRVTSSSIVMLDTPRYQYFLENDTLVLYGSGFDLSNASSNYVTLIQNDVEDQATCLVISALVDHVICELQRDSLGSTRLEEGAVFAALRMYDSIRWAPRLIGFYLPISVFDQVSPPDGVDLTSSPNLQFRLNATLPGRQPPPDWNVIDSAYRFFAQMYNIGNSTDLFAKFTYRTTPTLTAYDLDIWFTSTASAAIYNQRGVASNSSLLDSLQQMIVAETGGRFNVELVSSSVSNIDPSWPYLVFKLTIVNQGRNNPLRREETNSVRTVAAAMWGISATSLFGQSIASVDGSGYEFTLYFTDSASRLIFMQYKLPVNQTVVQPGAGINSLIEFATGRDFSSSFLRGSAYAVPAALQVDVSWPWIRFLITTLNDSAPASGPSMEELDVIQLESSRIIGLPSQDLFIQQKPVAKRAVGDQSLLTLYFVSDAAQNIFSNRTLYQNQTFISDFNSVVSNSTGGSYESEYLTDSTVVAPVSESVIPRGPALPYTIIIAIVIPIAAVIIVIIIVVAVIFRRRYAQLRRIEQTVEKLPEELKSVLSIKSGEIVLGKKLGEGSFGAVFLAKFRGNQVAVKQLSANNVSAQIADFFREASTMMAIKPHRNVVKMIGMCQELNNFSMVMEFCSEGSMDHLLREKGINAHKSPSEAEIYKWARGIALGMRHLASTGIVHRDLAARNILLDANYVPKISDFGFSRVIAAKSTGKTNATIGPIRWMSPENIRDQTYSEKSDVWSYGATLIEIITGDDPFPGIAPIECAAWIRDSVATPLNYVPLGISVPDWVFKLIGRCFTYEPADRPSFDDIVTFLNDHVPEGVVIDPNEEVPGADESSAAKRRRTKSQARREPEIEPDNDGATVYENIDAN